MLGRLGKNGLREPIGSSLTIKLMAVTGGAALLSVAALSWQAIADQQSRALRTAVMEADRLSTTIKLGAHYAMLLNSRDDITQIIRNVARLPDIVNIRIYNKEGRIKFSNVPEELETQTGIEAEACYVCHRTDPPRSWLTLDERTRMMSQALPGGSTERRVGILTPIENEPGCSVGCHAHPPEKRILGAIDVVFSMAGTVQQTGDFRNRLMAGAGLIFLVTAAAMGAFMLRFIKRPIGELIQATRLIARGEQPPGDHGVVPDAVIAQHDEIGQLGQAVSKMGRAIAEKQRELNRQRDEYQNLFANVPCIITVQDRNYRLLRYNREFAERFRPRPGDHCYRAYKGRSEKCPDCPVEKTFRTGKSTTSEESGPDSAGNMRHWLVTTAPLRDASGEVVAAMEMCLDITSRKQLEQQLVQAGKMTTLGEMATGVAHELNQPLTVIKAAVSYFRRKLKKGETIAPEVIEDLSGEIDAHVDRASRIINHLREFGRKPEVTVGSADVNAVVHRAFDLFRQQFKLREIEVVWELAEGLPPVRGDAGRLEQVFVNLFLNARDAIEDKACKCAAPGRELVAAKRIVISTVRANGEIQVRVADTGGGVPRSVRERIFEPFFTTKGVGKGTGLGLSISYGIVQDCGGRIALESSGPEGTTFLVGLRPSLPDLADLADRADQPEKTAVETADAPEPAPTPETEAEATP